ncbi:MAG: LuxR C-terminal-related transcriptional regulator [Nitrososphaerales archaeon]
MEKILNMSIENLTALLRTSLESRPTVFWIRNLEYDRQVYVSPSYEDIWGRSSKMLYEHPESFQKTVINEKDQHIPTILYERGIRTDIDPSMKFRIAKPNGDIVWIRDRSFPLIGLDNKPIAIAGIAEDITSVMNGCNSQSLYYKKLSENDAVEFKKILVQLFCGNIRVTPSASANQIQATTKKARLKVEVSINKKIVKLTKREAECLYHLLQGKSAKQTGNSIQLSQRTIEAYLDKVREKTNSYSRYDLMNQLSSSDRLALSLLFENK